MKKSVIQAILITTTSIILLEGCKPKSDQQKFNASDTTKISTWNKFFAGDSTKSHNITKKSPFDQPMPIDYADPCVKRYQDIYKNPAANVAIITKAYTQSMKFGSYNLGLWLTDLQNNTNTTQIKVVLGMYTGRIVNDFGAPEDRLTVFLYPYDAAGNPAKYRAVGAQTSPPPGNPPTYDLAGLDP